MRIRILGGWLLALAAILLLAQLTQAGPPPTPFSPWGTAKIDGEYVAEGTLVGAGCGGAEYASTPVTMIDGESWYFIDVPADDPETGEKDGCVDGETVGLTIDGLQADQTAAWASGESYRIDLTATRPSPSIDIEKQTNGVDADSLPGPYVLVGDPVGWSYTVTNTGNVTLTNVTVTDDPAGYICTIGTLAPEASDSCIKDSLAVIGQYTNTGTATGVYTETIVSDSDLSHYFGVYASIAMEKYTSGQDADEEPGPYFLWGDPVNWTYTATNTGNVTLTDVIITDSKDVTINCIGGGTLAPEDSLTCTASDSAERGQYTNIGTATGSPPIGPSVEASDPSHYFGADPSILVEKYTNDQDADSAPGAYIMAGDPVTWTYVVTNTGNITLTNVAVTDDQKGTVDCLTTTLAPYESTTCEATATAQSGQYANIGTATGTPPVGPNVEASDPSHYFGVSPSIDIEKYTNGQDADSAPGVYILVGDPITWTYTVTNTGNITLTNITITDDQLDWVCTITSLEPYQSDDCLELGIAAAGQYSNTATATATPPGGLDDVSDTNPSHYFGVQPEISIEKYTNDQDADSAPGVYIMAGDPVTWTYQVTNTGNVILTNITITDDQLEPNLVCMIASLEPDASGECLEYAIAAAGQYTNTATATATPPGGLDDVSDEDTSHCFGVDPSIVIEKYTKGQDADTAPGPYILATELITWTYVVTNTGNVPLTDITITDDQLDWVCTITSLEPDASDDCLELGIAAAGQYTNTATATATPPGGLDDISDEDPSHYFGTNPSIVMEKHTNGYDADEEPGPYILVGQPVTWTYTLTNTGNITLTDITIEDSQPGLTVLCPKTRLAVYESITCSATGTAVAGRYANVGTVTAYYSDTMALNTDPSHYFGADPSLDIEKYISLDGGANWEDADDLPGPEVFTATDVYFKFWVMNTGNVELTGITLEDSDFDLSGCAVPDPLAPSDYFDCVIGPLEAITDQHTNAGSVSVAYTDDLGNSATPSDEDDANYLGVVPSSYIYLPLVLKDAGP